MFGNVRKLKLLVLPPTKSKDQWYHGQDSESLPGLDAGRKLLLLHSDHVFTKHTSRSSADVDEARIPRRAASPCHASGTISVNTLVLSRGRREERGRLDMCGGGEARAWLGVARPGFTPRRLHNLCLWYSPLYRTSPWVLRSQSSSIMTAPSGLCDRDG